MDNVNVDIFHIYLKKTLVANFCCLVCRSNIKVSSPWACQLVVVVKLACLNETNSDAGGGFIPVKVKKLILSFQAHKVLNFTKKPVDISLNFIRLL